MTTFIWALDTALDGSLIGSHVPVAPQRLEGALGLAVLRAAGALGDLRVAKLLDDLPHASRLRGDRKCARMTPEAAVAHPIPVCEVERDDRNRLALDVLPDVELGPVEQGVHADVGPALELGLELVPHLRRLVGDVPFHLLVARAEVALLRTGAILVATDADDDARVPLLLEHGLKGVPLEAAAAFHARRPSVGVREPVPERGLVLPDDELQVPLAAQLVAVLDHARDLVARIDVDERERDVTEERLPRKPQEHGRVLPDAPEHGQALQLAVSLAQDIDRFVLERRERVHQCTQTERAHQSPNRSPTARSAA